MYIHTVCSMYKYYVLTGKVEFEVPVDQISSEIE